MLRLLYENGRNRATLSCQICSELRDAIPILVRLPGMGKDVASLTFCRFLLPVLIKHVGLLVEEIKDKDV